MSVHPRDNSKKRGARAAARAETRSASLSAESLAGNGRSNFQRYPFRLDNSKKRGRNLLTILVGQAGGRLRVHRLRMADGGCAPSGRLRVSAEQEGHR